MTVAELIAALQEHAPHDIVHLEDGTVVTQTYFAPATMLRGEGVFIVGEPDL